jgi:hypothetical protein
MSIRPCYAAFVMEAVLSTHLPSDENERHRLFKALIFGTGRTCGLEVQPRNFSGTPREKNRALAAYVLAIRKTPTDSSVGCHCVAPSDQLASAVDSDADSATLVVVAESYIRSRVGMSETGTAL